MGLHFRIPGRSAFEASGRGERGYAVKDVTVFLDLAHRGPGVPLAHGLHRNVHGAHDVRRDGVSERLFALIVGNDTECVDFQDIAQAGKWEKSLSEVDSIGTLHTGCSEIIVIFGNARISQACTI